jgi:hypothetical protein
VADPIETLVDYLVYVPLGAALTVRDMVPSLIEQGREQHVALARVVGQFAVKMGRSKAAKEWAALVERSNARSSSAQQRGASADSNDAGSEPSTQSDDASAASSLPTSADPPEAPPGPSLAIQEYDFLAASQIVARLVDLSEAERAAIEAYERANRNRRTVLGRIDQLRSGEIAT